MSTARSMVYLGLLSFVWSLGCATARNSTTSAKSWPISSGQLDRGDFEAHLGSSHPGEVAELLGPQLAQAPDLTVVVTLIKNRSRQTPVRVDPATVRLKLKSGETLTPLTREQVRAWAEATGSTVPSLAVLDPIEAKSGEALAAAAVFKLPAGADTTSAEAEMKVDLGAEGHVPVTSRLF
jgi:hypothetical protein